MKEFMEEIPDNTYILSETDISVIHALCFYAPDGMTVKADNAMHRIEEMFRMHDAVGKIKVWID